MDALHKELMSEQIAWRDTNRDTELCTEAVVKLKEMVDWLLARCPNRGSKWDHYGPLH
jgi:hypothetical protein